MSIPAIVLEKGDKFIVHDPSYQGGLAHPLLQRNEGRYLSEMDNGEFAVYSSRLEFSRTYTVKSSKIEDDKIYYTLDAEKNETISFAFWYDLVLESYFQGSVDEPVTIPFESFEFEI